MALLHEGADAKATNARRRNRKIALLGTLKFCNLLVVHDGPRQCQGVLGRQGMRRHLGDQAINLDSRRKVAGDEQITAFARNHQSQQVVDEFTGLFAFHGVSLNKSRYQKRV